MPTVTIRPATDGDVEQIVEFNLRLAAETEDTTLDADTVRRGVRGLLADKTRGAYYLADTDSVVGQIMHTREWSDWRNGDIWWIQSVYVHAAHRRRGVFRSLYAYVQELARKSPNVVGLRLYVEHENTTARATYTQLGMSAAPYGVMQDLFTAPRQD